MRSESQGSESNGKGTNDRKKFSMEDRIMESFISEEGEEEDESLPQRPILVSELSQRTSLLDTDILSKKESLTSILEAIAGRFPSVGYCQVSGDGGGTS